MRTVEERERRLAVARAASGVELLLGGIAIAIVGFVFVSWSPVLSGGSSPRTELLMALGGVGVVVGFTWLLRIRFKGPEDGARSNWRSH